MICNRCRRLVGRNKLKDGFCIDVKACREPIDSEKTTKVDRHPLSYLDYFQVEDSENLVKYPKLEQKLRDS